MDDKKLLLNRKRELFKKSMSPKSVEIKNVVLETLVENPYQPRMEMENIDDLVASIEKEGLLQPILVSPDGSGGYYIVAGHRRTEAFRKLGRTSIPAIVLKKQEEISLASKAIAENFQREDLNPIELALALDRYRAKFNKTLDEVASEIGKNKSEVSRILSLLNLPKDIVEEVRTKKTTKDVRSLWEINSYAKKLEKLEISNFEIEKEQKALYYGLLSHGREWLKSEIKRKLRLLREEEERKKPPVFIKKDKRRGVQINIRVPEIDEEKLKLIEDFIKRTIEK